MARIFNFKIKDKEFQFISDTHKALWHDFLKDSEGKIVQVTRYTPVRSDQQNRFYWLYLSVIETETGNSANDLHEYFKRVHLPPKFITVMNKEVKIPASTTDLNKIEFGEYLDKICAETNVPIPDPVAAGYYDHLVPTR